MAEYIDLHCHWIAQIDDGARSPEEGLALLRALQNLGFSKVIATPHMRPGMFDNTQRSLGEAYERMLPLVRADPTLPEVGLSSEHYFDETVYDRILTGQALPYPGGRAILLEFYGTALPAQIERRLGELRRAKLLPVIAHPERYECIWQSPELLENLVDAGAAALLDASALSGKYGRRPKKCAMDLMERGLYHAACSDAHRPADAEPLAAAMQWIRKRYGEDEVTFLFRDGPRAILDGEVAE